MNRTKIRIGYAPTRRNVFGHPDARLYREKILELIKGWDAEIIDIAGINDEGLLKTDDDIAKAVKIYRDNDIDGLFIANCNFGEESVAARVAATLRKPVLLWGPQDDVPPEHASRTRDTQCGLFTMGKILRRYNVPFTYLINSPLGAKSFEEGYKAFCAVCSVVKTFKRIRVMQVSVRPDPFWSVICNEGELLEKYGIQVFPVTLQQVKEEIDAMAGTPEEADTVEYLRGVMNLPDAPADPLNRVARLYLAIRSLGRKNNCTSAAVQCWGPMQKTAGASICTVNGLLTDEGMPVACEMDVLGAVTMEIQQATCLNAKPVFFADMTIRHPTNPNAELLWHCGNFPPSLACDPAQRSMILEEPPGQNEWEIKHGDITICRFDGDHGEYSLMMGEGKGVDGPKTNGTYSWFEVDDWPKWEKHLVTGPYVHHCAGVHAKTAAILYEACKYMGVVPDPINPTADRIERFWREGV